MPKEWRSALVYIYASATGITALLLTLLDLDKTFYVPRSAQSRWKLRVLWWGFALANAVVAALVYANVRKAAAFHNWNPLLLAVTVGMAYLAMLRLKFTTFKFEGREVPFGIEAFYEASRDFIFRRINRIAREARSVEAKKLATEFPLKELKIDAHYAIEHDALMSEQKREEDRKWLNGVVMDAIDDDQKRLILAIYILSGVRAGTLASDSAEMSGH